MIRIEINSKNCNLHKLFQMEMQEIYIDHKYLIIYIYILYEYKVT